MAVGSLSWARTADRQLRIGWTFDPSDMTGGLKGLRPSHMIGGLKGFRPSDMIGCLKGLRPLLIIYFLKRRRSRVRPRVGDHPRQPERSMVTITAGTGGRAADGSRRPRHHWRPSPPPHPRVASTTGPRAPVAAATLRQRARPSAAAAAANIQKVGVFRRTADWRDGVEEGGGWRGRCARSARVTASFLPRPWPCRADLVLCSISSKITKVHGRFLPTCGCTPAARHHPLRVWRRLRPDVRF